MQVGSYRYTWYVVDGRYIYLQEKNNEVKTLLANNPLYAEYGDIYLHLFRPVNNSLPTLVPRYTTYLASGCAAGGA